MKAALFAVALGAFVAVGSAEEEEKPLLPEEEVAGAEALFEDADKIDWDRFSPAALGMKLNFDELSEEELEKVVSGFISLGLIEEGEREGFKDSLTHPAMRAMLVSVQDNWSNTMQKILRDPMFSSFLHKLKGGVDDAALGQIVGFDGGIADAVKRIQEEQEENGEDADDDGEGPSATQPPQQPSK